MNIIPKNTNILHKQSLKLSDDVVGQLAPKPTPLAYNFDAIPRDFKDLNNWVLWKYILKDGKWTKIPYQVTNRSADSTKSATWTTFDNAVKAYGTGKFSGIGFCIGDSGLTCVDIDHEDEWKKGKLDKLLDGLNNKYYMETSPSGNGYHLWIKATKPNGMGCKSKSFHDNFVEIYNSKRFMTMTGVVINGHTSIQEAQTELETVFAPLMPKPKTPQIPTQQHTPLNLDDKAIVDLIISSAARGTSGAITFCNLHNNGSPDGKDYSGNELAYFNSLAFYTGNNAAQMDRIYRSGAMMRDKWNREDYRQRTLDKAMAGCTTFYNSKHNQSVTFISDVDFNDDSDPDNVISNIEPDADPFGISSVDIRKPHGLAGVICQEMSEMTYRRLNLSYPLAAMHMLNTMKGKRLGLDGRKTNLITLVIALTGAGKDTSSQAVDQVTEAYGACRRGVKDFVEAPRSDKDAVVTLLEDLGHSSFEVDEAQGLFNGMNSSKAPTYLQRLGDELLKMATDTKYKLAPLHTRELRPMIEKEIEKLEFGIEKEKGKAQELKESTQRYADAKAKHGDDDTGSYFAGIDPMMGTANTGLNEGKIDAMKRKLEVANQKLGMIENGIKHPTVNLMMFSTPINMDSIGDTKNIESGLMARALVWREHEGRDRAVRKINYAGLSTSLIERLGRIYGHGDDITISTEADSLLDDIFDYYEQNKFRNHPTKGGLYVRLVERIKTIASILASESGIISVEDIRYSLVAILRHIDDVTFLRNKNAASDSAEDMVLHIGDLILQKAIPLGVAQSKLKQDVFACCKPAKVDAKDAKARNRQSLYDYAIESMLKSGSIYYIEGTKKIRRK